MHTGTNSTAREGNLPRSYPEEVIDCSGPSSAVCFIVFNFQNGHFCVCDYLVPTPLVYI